jgi:immune inhibitor A
LRKKRKAASAALAALLGLSTLAVGPGMSTAQTVDAEKILNEVKSDHVHGHSQGGSPFDLGIANDERLIEMLKKEGKLSKNASPAEAEKALSKFLNKKAENAKKESGELSEDAAKTKAKLKKEMKKNGLTSGKGNKLGQAKKNSPDSVKEEKYNGVKRTDEVLVLLIDYPDRPHNKMTPDETDMYYKGDDAYSREHYQDMLFGEGGWKGPDGKTYVSMKQYYEQQSGGSYSVDGNVAGWYTASKPAAEYGGNDPQPDGNDVNARGLVKEALAAAAADPDVDLGDYDKWDRYDLDGDGDYLEPDGLVDHLMVIHSGVGEEAGGGSLGSDAIWSHRWSLQGVTPIAGTEAEVDYWGGAIAAFDYTIEPEDGAVGVMTHEFGHDLGLPDEYDTQYSGTGEAVAYWSIMASGSWAGDLPGAQPTGFSPYAKEMLQASAVVDNQGTKGNWLTGTEVDLKDVDKKGMEVLLDEAVTKGTNNDVVKVTLPKKEVQGIQPEFGEKYYYSTKGDDLHTKLVSPEFDLTGATTATFDYKTLYEIEYDYDFLNVTAVTSSGEKAVIDVIGDEDTNGDGSAETTNGKWVDKSYDLSQFAGEKVSLNFEYVTDGGLALNGFALDNATLKVDGNVVFEDDAEGAPLFETDGFTVSNGIDYKDHYYLLEWRSHNGVDEGLANIRRGASLMEYNEGLVVWYVDNSYSDNWTGKHPGDGFLGVVDADQSTNYWSDRAVGTTRYQIHDAAFSLNKSEKMFLDYSDLLGVTMKDNHTARNPLFDDSANYSNKGMVDAGRNVPNYGLKFRVTGESADGSVGKVLIYK